MSQNRSVKIQFKAINLKKDYDICVGFRKDSYICSFGTDDGYEKSISGYHERMTNRFQDNRWFYRHIWYENQIIGQLEFKSFSQWEQFGYVHLMYVIPEYRGLGIANQAQEYIEKKLISCGCKGAVLSVSRINQRAVHHYKKWGWYYVEKNPKHELTDFFRREFPTS